MFNKIALLSFFLMLFTLFPSCKDPQMKKDDKGTNKTFVYQVTPSVSLNYSVLCPELSNQCYKCNKAESLYVLDLTYQNPIHFDYCRAILKRPYHVLFQCDRESNQSKRLFTPYYDEVTNLNLEKSYIFLQYRF